MAAPSDSEASQEDVKPKTREPLFTWKHVFPIIVSVLALIIALRQSFIANDAATLTAYDRGVGPVLELDKAYVGNSDLRPFFYENKRLEGADPARARTLALAEMTLDVFENVLTQVTEHPNRFPSDQYEGDVAWMTGMFKSSEVLRSYLDSHKSWYSANLRGIRRRVNP
jgi:hypothetical protein